jgi:membrane-bound metal-dependent hydrolase YbcI (DUF457 family)
VDNLTHSLVGAVMGRMGLKRLSPRAMPAMIIAANLQDIDSFVARGLGCEPIAAHRGFTHGVAGDFVMPFFAVQLFGSGKSCTRAMKALSSSSGCLSPASLPESATHCST